MVSLGEEPNVFGASAPFEVLVQSYGQGVVPGTMVQEVSKSSICCSWESYVKNTVPEQKGRPSWLEQGPLA